MTACCKHCNKRHLTATSNFPKLVDEKDLSSSNYDGILVVVPPVQAFTAAEKFESVIKDALKCDPSLVTELAILPLPNFPAGRLVYAPTGPLDPDYDDVRSLKEAAVKGTKRAVKAGIKKLLVVVEEYPKFEDSQLVTLLGVFDALYVPLQERERSPSNAQKVEVLGVYTADENKTRQLVNLVKILETGLYLARDIGGADPERMTPINVQKYVEEVFGSSSVAISVIDDPNVFSEEYPLFEAVNRAASTVERHCGRIMFLEYNPSGEIKKTVMLVGKGVTYDTGGADIKAGGVMISMSRDKCGAAAVAGFMKIVNELKPPHIRVVGAMSMVRNSIGSNCYVSDEIITSRSKSTVRVGYTDAEGRMILADVLCRIKEMALIAVNPHIFTIATLTGHAALAVGSGYTIIMDNGPARNARVAKSLQRHGEGLGEAMEISTIRREDFAFHKGKTEGEDILQAFNGPSTVTQRGHQGPAAFLMMASGLDKHGSGSQQPLKYSHFDILGSCGDFPHPATGVPILALANAFLLHSSQ